MDSQKYSIFMALKSQHFKAVKLTVMLPARLALLGLILLVPFVAISQEQLPGEIAVVPPSPAVSEHNQYIDVPVSLYTGLPSVNIPIHTVQVGQYSLPISLSYHGGGLRVDAHASWIGAGWSLNATGSISRTVQGVADEWDGGQFYGYLSKKTTRHLYDANQQVDWNQIYGCSNNAINLLPIGPSSSPLNLMDSITWGKLDTQPDIFYYHLPGGGSGKFVFDRFQADPQPVMLQATTDRIIQDPFGTALPSPAALNNDYTWQIEDDRGIIYEFTQKAERTEMETYGSTSVSWDRHQSSWFLTRILAYGEWINFQYEQEVIDYDLKFSETMELAVAGGNCQENCKPQQSHTNSYNRSTVTTWRLSHISTSKGEHIDFVTGGFRTDLPGSKRLSGIRISRHGQEVSYFQLNQSHYPGGKLRLDQLQQIAGGSSLAPHTFSYYEYQFMPAYGSNNQDYWGYFNGASTNTSRIPEYRDDDWWLLPGRPVNRKPSLYAQAGSLKRWTYPTGGYTELEYELHDYYNPHYKPLETFSVSASGATSNGLPVVQWSAPFTVGAQGARADIVKTSGTTGVFDNTGTLWKRNSSTGNYQQYSPSPAGGNRLVLPQGTYQLKASNSVPGDVVTITLHKNEMAPQPRNEPVGGVRVKRQTVADPVSGQPTITKEYRYVQADGSTSSGKLFAPFLHATVRQWMPGYLTSIEAGGNARACYDVPSQEQTLINLSTTSVLPAITTQGSHVGYDRVEIWQLDENGDPAYGKTVNEYINDNPGGFAPPFASRDQLGYQNGNLSRETVYRSQWNGSSWSFHLQQETQHDYGTALILTGNHPGAPAVNIPFFALRKINDRFCYDCAVMTQGNNFLADVNYRTVRWRPLLSTLARQYDASGALEFSTTTHYQYNPSLSAGANHYYAVQITSDAKEGGGKLVYQTFERDPAHPGLLTRSEKYRDHQGSRLQIEGAAVNYQGTLPSTLYRWEFSDNGGSYQKSRAYTFLPGESVVGEAQTFVPGQLQAEKQQGFVWNSGANLVLAAADNSSQAALVYSSFEPLQQGNWTLSQGLIRNNLQGKTGNYYYDMSPANSILRTDNRPPDHYRISLWAKNGLPRVTLSGANTATLSLHAQHTDNQGWTLYIGTFAFTQTTNALILTGTADIDEVLLAPQAAQASTFTYEPHSQRVTSTSSPSHQIMHYQYDAFHRLLKELDGNRKVLRQHQYQDVNFQAPPQN